MWRTGFEARKQPLAYSSKEEFYATNIEIKVRIFLSHQCDLVYGLHDQLPFFLKGKHKLVVCACPPEADSSPKVALLLVCSSMVGAVALYAKGYTFESY